MSKRDHILHLLNPCPGCDAATHFPAMPSIQSVIAGLLEQYDGNCPICGTKIVVAELTPPKPTTPAPPITTQSRVIDLPLSIRCRAVLNRLGCTTLSDALEMDRETLTNALADHADEFRALATQLETNS